MKKQKKVHNTTEIDYETAKLMDLRRKKKSQIDELKREISDLDYEIGFKMGVEEGEINVNYEIAHELLKEDYPLNEISTMTNLTTEQVKQLVQTI